MGIHCSKKVFRYLASSLFFVGGGGSVSVLANDAGANSSPLQLEEVMVTATKRTKSVQDVPQTISVLGQDELEIQGIETGADFARRVPGLLLNETGKNLASNFVIRGIASSTNAEEMNQSVSVYIDDIPVTSSNTSIQPDLRLYDVSRVEVLKGPQGTLFGSGALAGVVRIVTNKADASGFDYSFSTDIASNGNSSIRQRYNGMVNVPLVEDKLALRIVGYAREEDGYVDNIGTGIDNANSYSEMGGRLSLVWDATDNFRANINVLYQDSEPDDSALFDPELGKHVRSSAIAEVATVEMTNYNLTLEYDNDFATFTSSSNFSMLDTYQTSDLNGGFPFTLFPWLLNRTTEEENFVQEIRMVSNSDSRLDWVVGGFYAKRETDRYLTFYTSQEFVDSRGITGLADTRHGSNAFVDGWRTNIDEELAAYAEFGYQLTDTLKATMGIRRGTTEADDIRHPIGVDGIGAFVGGVIFGGANTVTLPGFPTREIGTGKQNVTTTKWSLAWEPTDEMNLYIMAAEGFRAAVVNGSAQVNGGVSQLDPNDVVIPPIADPDSLWNYEIGMKATWLDGRINTNVSLFYIDWQDIQLQAVRQSDGGTFVTNAGAAVSKGVEFEMLALATEKIQLGLNFSFQNAEITELTDEEAALTGAVEGSELVSPDFSTSGFIEYSTPFNGGDFYARTDIQYVGDYVNAFPFVSGNPGVPSANTARTDSYENVNVSIGWSSDKWSISLYGENVLDNDDHTYIYPLAFVDDRFATLRPRTFGIRLAIH